MARSRLLRALLLAGLALAWATPAPIVAFNNEAQAAVRELGIPSQIASRIYALVHTAQYTALSEGADEELAAAQAAYAGHTALSLLFPWRWARLDKALKPLIADLPADVRREGEAAGRAAATAVVKQSLDDGFARYAPFEPAQPGAAQPGQYRFAPGQAAAIYPQIRGTRPLVLAGVEEFKPAPPLDPASPEFAAQLGEVFQLGRNTSTARTADQADIAHFWADGNTTSSVAGHFNAIAQALLPNDTSVADAARLFAELNAATWDASIAAYTAKYAQPSWRPITAIRAGAVPAASDPTWTPFLNTPPHPEHPSGHSATAGAAAAVIAARLGNETEFTAGSEYTPALEPRTYASVWDAVDEVNWSRVYGGIHLRHAVEEGARLGERVAQAVLAAFDGKVARLRDAAEQEEPAVLKQEGGSQEEEGEEGSKQGRN